MKINTISDESMDRLLTEEVYSATLLDNNGNKIKSTEKLPNPFYFSGSSAVKLNTEDIIDFIDYVNRRNTKSNDPINKPMLLELSRLENKPYSVKIDKIPESDYDDITNNRMIIYGYRYDRDKANTLVHNSRDYEPEKDEKKYTVHHINKKEFDNRPENLIGVENNQIHQLLEIMPSLELKDNSYTLETKDDSFRALIPNNDGKFVKAKCEIIVKITKI